MNSKITILPRAIEGQMQGEVKLDNSGLSVAEMHDGDQITIELTAVINNEAASAMLKDKHRLR